METDNDNLDLVNFLGEKAQRNLLKYAVCRQIFCRCGNILDIRRSVLIETTNQMMVSCRECGERFLAETETKLGKEVFAKLVATHRVEITRGYKVRQGKVGKGKEKA